MPFFAGGATAVCRVNPLLMGCGSQRDVATVEYAAGDTPDEVTPSSEHHTDFSDSRGKSSVAMQDD